MAILLLQDGTSLLVQDGTDLLLQADSGPTITLQPTNQTVDVTDLVTYTITATGTGTLLYQWYETTAGLMSGETAATLDFNTVAADDGTSYYCIVTDDLGATQTSTATLTVVTVFITVQPASQGIVDLEEVTFSVTANGEGTLLYQWYEDTAGLLSGETASTLVFNVATGDDANEYYVIVTDDIGQVQSDNAVLTVLPLPVITVQPTAQVAAEDGDEVTYSVTATGSGTITYQWYETTAGLIAGETASTYVFDGFYTLTGNSYYVIVSDDNGGFVTSDTALLTVGVPGLDFEGDFQLKGPNGWLELLPRMKWSFPYIPGKTYQPEMVVRDTGWVCVANTVTAARAAPQSNGSPFISTFTATWDETNFVLLNSYYSNTIVLQGILAGQALVCQVPVGNVGLLHVITLIVDGLVAFTAPFIPSVAGLTTIAPFSRIGVSGITVEVKLTISNSVGNTRIYHPQHVGFWTGYSTTEITSVTGDLNGVSSDTAYGIDVVSTPAISSPDWDILHDGNILV